MRRNQIRSLTARRCAHALPGLREEVIAAEDPDMLAKVVTSAPTVELDEAQAELSAMRRRLRAAAHEIRTPLTGASTIVDILAVSELASGPTRDYVLLLKDAVAQRIA